MAPEILEGVEYDGQSADLFAAAVNLVCMVGQPPFAKASSSDVFYQ